MGQAAIQRQMMEQGRIEELRWAISVARVLKQQRT